MFKFHPHVGGINQTTNPVFFYSTEAMFIKAIQALVDDESLYPIIADDVTFHHCDGNHDDCSEAFKHFVEETCWRKVYAVSVEKNNRVIQVGYSNSTFGPHVS